MLQTLSKRKETRPINTLTYVRKPMAKFNSLHKFMKTSPSTKR